MQLTKKGETKSSLDAIGFELMTLQYRSSALTELSGQLEGAHFVSFMCSIPVE